MDFNSALTFTLKHEGGYVNNPRDPGGETNFGISKRSYPNLDIRNLTIQKASEIYFRDFWVKSSAHKVPWPLSLSLFDYAVNAGVTRSIKDLQKVVGETQDGIFGPKTLMGVGRRITAVGPNGIVVEHCHSRMSLFADLVKRKPSQLIFLSGWTNRVFDLLLTATRL